MALFTDSTINTLEDLTAHDSGVLDVSGIERIDLTKKLGLAQEELAVELTGLLAGLESLEPVVVTTPLRLWHAFQSLALVYRDAYHNQLNDRYKGKRDEYTALAKWAKDKLMETGVGMAFNPVPKAHPPELTYIAGPPAGATYFACVSWLNAQAQEGAASDWRSLTVPDGNTLSVQPAQAPSSATGWNVYVGLSPETLCLQNATPLGLAEAWLQEAAVSTTGRPPGTGQIPNYLRELPRILQRG